MEVYKVTFLLVVSGHFSFGAVYPLENGKDIEVPKSLDTQYAILDCFGAQVYNNMGGSLTECLLNLVLFKLSPHKHDGVKKLSFFGGLIELERKFDGQPVSNRLERSLNASSAGEKLDRLSQEVAVKLHVLDGFNLRVERSLDTVSVGVEEDDEDDDGRAGLSSGNKKKKKSGIHKKYKQFLSILPMFLIPVFIQATLLPLFLATLKLIAIKSVFIGKLALLLVGYNALRNASIRRKQDEVDEHIAIEHYGYNGDMEYGAMLNSRAL